MATPDDPTLEDVSGGTTNYQLDDPEDKEYGTAALGEGELGIMGLGKEESKRTTYTNDDPEYKD